MSKVRVELKDHKSEIQKLARMEVRFLCKDAVWVECPYDALVLDKWCDKPDVPCEHRGEDVLTYSEDYEVRYLDEVSGSRKTKDQERKKPEESV